MKTTESAISTIHAHSTTISHRSRTTWGRRSQSTISARKLSAHVVVTMRATAEVYWLPRMIGGQRIVPMVVVGVSASLVASAATRPATIAPTRNPSAEGLRRTPRCRRSQLMAGDPSKLRTTGQRWRRNAA